MSVPRAVEGRAALDPRRRRGCIALLSAATGIAWPALVGAQGEAGRRSALVIGNSRYPNGALRNAGNDARLMAAVAAELGFEIELLLDAGLRQMLEKTRTWVLRSGGHSTRLFYYAGHGAQHRGQNYLVPVDAELRSEDDLPGRTMDVGDLIDRLARAPQGVNIAVLDACRALPQIAAVPGSRTRGTPPRPVVPGLAPVSPPRGTLVAYSTAPGAVATDAPGADNSPFTRNLAEQLRTPGLSIESAFKRTRAAVLAETRGTQVPWETSSLVGNVCLSTTAAARCEER